MRSVMVRELDWFHLASMLELADKTTQPSVRPTLNSASRSEQSTTLYLSKKKPLAIWVCILYTMQNLDFRARSLSIFDEIR